VSKEIIVAMIDNKPVIRTGDVWKRFGYSSHKNLKDIILQRADRFEKYGVLRFEIAKPSGSPKGGRPEKSILLNERQFLTLVQYVSNTDETMDFKDAITDEFFRMREALAKVSTPSPYIEQVRKILLLDAPSELIELYDNYVKEVQELLDKPLFDMLK
jgi:phage regulator Rha-like protein